MFCHVVQRAASLSGFHSDTNGSPQLSKAFLDAGFQLLNILRHIFGFLTFQMFSVELWCWIVCMKSECLYISSNFSPHTEETMTGKQKAQSECLELSAAHRVTVHELTSLLETWQCLIRSSSSYVTGNEKKNPFILIKGKKPAKQLLLKIMWNNRKVQSSFKYSQQAKNELWPSDISLQHHHAAPQTAAFTSGLEVGSLCCVYSSAL